MSKDNREVVDFKRLLFKSQKIFNLIQNPLELPKFPIQVQFDKLKGNLSHLVRIFPTLESLLEKDQISIISKDLGSLSISVKDYMPNSTTKSTKNNVGNRKLVEAERILKVQRIAKLSQKSAPNFIKRTSLDSEITHIQQLADKNNIDSKLRSRNNRHELLGSTSRIAPNQLNENEQAILDSNKLVYPTNKDP